MRLGDHFQQIKKKYNDIFFSGICFDHRQFKKNYIFFAIKGNNIDGNNFIPSVIKKGCKIIVTEKNFEEWKKLNNSNKSYYEYLGEFYGE